MTKKTKIITAVIIMLIVVGVVFLATQKHGPGKYDALAQCLKDKGVIFYGTFWCPHCQNQKKAFGSSTKLLPYVECSTSDGQEQLQVCKDKKIEGYPTWEFKDGSRLEGEISFEVLASKSGCALPQ